MQKLDYHEMLHAKICKIQLCKNNYALSINCRRNTLHSPQCGRVFSCTGTITFKMAAHTTLMEFQIPPSAFSSKGDSQFYSLYDGLQYCLYDLVSVYSLVALFCTDQVYILHRPVVPSYVYICQILCQGIVKHHSFIHSFMHVYY